MKIGHQMTGKIVGFAYCVRCGHIALNNEASKKQGRDGCDPKSIERRQKWAGNPNR